MVKRGTTFFLALATVLGLSFGGPAQAADIVARADRTAIGLNESVTLTITADGSVDDDPDFSPLQRDFEIGGQSHGSNYSIVNGHASRQTTWQLTLFPRRTGALVIPAISFGSDRSNPVHITVSEGEANATEKHDVSLAVESDPQTAYVQSQVVVTVSLYHATNLDNATMSQPEFNSDVIVKPLGEARQYTVTLSGRDYNVYEQRYAVFPQQAGQLIMNPIRVKGVRAGGGNFFDPFNMRRQGNPMGGQSFRLQSAALPITVKPQPAQFSGRWLPASDVKLSEQWSADPDAITVGEPITRTLRLSATGLSGDQLPPIEQDAPEAFKTYPDQAKTDDRVQGKSILGIREQSVALMATQPGHYELPAVEIPWWNTKTDKLEVARLPARSITVLPAAGSGMQPAQRPAVSPPAVETPIAEPSIPETQAVVPTPEQSYGAPPWRWMALSGVLALGWLITAVLWWRQTRRQLPPPVSEGPRPDIAGIEKRLRQACNGNRAAEAKDAVLDWARARWPDRPLSSLEKLAERAGPDFAQQIKILSAQLYSADASAPTWNGAEFWQGFQAFKAAPERRTRAANDALEPLYRIGSENS